MTKLIVAGYELEVNDEAKHDFFVTFHGPKDTAYECGVWRVHVVLPIDYPFDSPSIGFTNRILHPNIDEISGTVCLDVINQTWTPLYSLVNVFDIFLPQLLTYPNATDPLNAKAGKLFLDNKGEYEREVRDHVKVHASREAYLKSKEKKDNNSLSSVPELSDGAPCVNHSNQEILSSERSKLQQSLNDKGYQEHCLVTIANSTSSPKKNLSMTAVDANPRDKPSQTLPAAKQYFDEPNTPLSETSLTDVADLDDENLLLSEPSSVHLFLSWDSNPKHSKSDSKTY